MQRTHISVAVIGAALLLASAVAFFVLLAFPDDADARSRWKIVTRTFSNPSKVLIPVGAPTTTSGVASPYPSEINVSGLRRGSIRDVNVKINSFSHTVPKDVDMLLVGPQGQNAILMSDAAGVADANGVSFSIDDEAPAQLPSGDTAPPITNGASYQPTNLFEDAAPDIFPTPAPTPSGNEDLSIFDFTNPNGTWKLYVVDDQGADVGEFTGGWSLEIKAKVRRR